MLSIILLLISLLDKLKSKATGSKRNQWVTIFADKSINKLEGLKNKREATKKKGLFGDMLFFLSLVLAIIEIVPIMLFAFSLFFIVFLALTLIVIIFTLFTSFFAFKNITDIVNDVVNKPPAQSAGGGGYATGNTGVLAWTDEELALNVTALTDKEQMYYKLGILINKSISGYGVLANPYTVGVEPNTDLDIRLMWGTSAIESSLKLNQSNTAFDIFSEYSDYATYSKGSLSTYQLFGIDYRKTLGSYIKNAKVREAVKTAYPLPLKGSSVYDNQFLPHGVMVFVAHYPNYVTSAKSGIKSVSSTSSKDIIKDRMAHWGTTSDELYGMLFSFLAMNQFHGAEYKEYKGYLDFWISLYMLSGTDDTTRSLNNYKLVSKSGGSPTVGYDESAARHIFMGKPLTSEGAKYNAKNGHYSNWKLADNDIRLALNGKIIDKPLWTFVMESYPNNADMKSSWTQLVSIANAVSKTGGYSSKTDRFMNYYYGYIALLQSNRFIDTVSAKMTLMQTKKSDGNTITAFDPAGNTRVKGLKTIEYINKNEKYLSSTEKSYIKKTLIPLFGSVAQFEDPDSPQAKTNYKDVLNGVPFYGQNSMYKEKYGTIKWHPAQSDTFNKSGCMVYSCSYVLSAKFQAIVNPPETAAIMMAFNALDSDGIHMSSMASMLNTMGFRSKYLEAGYDFATVDKAVKEGGMAILAYSGASHFTGGSNHFIVMTSAKEVNGKSVYTVYSSSDLVKSEVAFSRSDMTTGLHRRAVIIY